MCKLLGSHAMTKNIYKGFVRNSTFSEIVIDTGVNLALSLLIL